MRLYLDANAIIYAVEGSSAVRQTVLDHLELALGQRSGAVLTSVLSRIECRSKPISKGASTLLAEYDAFFAQPGLLLLALSDDFVESGTMLRAKYGLKTVDALHLSSAIASRCDVFLTGDAKLARCREIAVELLHP